MVMCHSHIASEASTSLTAKAQATLRAHQEMGQLLDALVKLSAVQSAPLEEADWTKVLDHKQRIMDELEVRSPGALVEQSRQLAERLIEDDQVMLAQQLEQAVADTRNRFMEVTALEQHAQEVLQQQLTALHQSMLAIQRKCQATRTYRRSTPLREQSRFLDGVR